MSSNPHPSAHHYYFRHCNLQFLPLDQVGCGFRCHSTIILWSLYICSALCSAVLYRIPFLLIHISLLIFFDPYLYIHRQIFYPLRQIIMPLVVSAAKSENIAEGAETWYVVACSWWHSNYQRSKGIVSIFSEKSQERNEEKIKSIRKVSLKVVTTQSDFLSIWKDLPVLIDYERKVVNKNNGPSFVEEFIKRFLVIFLWSNAYMDRYFPSFDRTRIWIDTFLQTVRNLLR